MVHAQSGPKDPRVVEPGDRVVAGDGDAPVRTDLAGRDDEGSSAMSKAVSRVKAAEAMYGTGSAQHKAAIRRYGTGGGPTTPVVEPAGQPETNTTAGT
jgi:hypothetical protein